jgi:ribonuclease P/MRP protein subunit RPP1
MKNYYDLHIHSKEPEKTVKLAETLGYRGICLVEYFDKENKFESFANNVSELSGQTKVNLLVGAEIKTKKTGEIQKKARSALRYADLIIVSGGDERTNRAVSDCWEADVLAHPEREAERDAMEFRNSGIDHITAKFMAERGIAIEINFSDILNSRGMLRSQIIARMAQNIMLSKKFGVPLITTSGAHEDLGLRAPMELAAVAMQLGMKEEQAIKTIGENPAGIVRKARDRKNPKIITKGLEVLKWGKTRPQKEKKQFGWY